MESHYLITGLVIALAIFFVILMIRKNLKDKRELEKTITKSDLEPEEHRKDEL